ncbi:hypothetical protein UY3_07463 [Chelonia mydas]|uniref:Uncharacterized protein n=1 Tax=Chelonia mydas TaxID=8469 RepID=M7BE93_CHEMY|nr:hypothetical protein UY3_07463 [Chelonia mydas]
MVSQLARESGSQTLETHPRTSQLHGKEPGSPGMAGLNQSHRHWFDWPPGSPCGRTGYSDLKSMTDQFQTMTSRSLKSDIT